MTGKNYKNHMTEYFMKLHDNCQNMLLIRKQCFHEFCTWLKSLGWGIEILNDVSPNFNRSFLGNV